MAYLIADPDASPPPIDTGAARRLVNLPKHAWHSLGSLEGDREHPARDDVLEVLALLDAAREAQASLLEELAGHRVAAKEARMLAAARFSVALPSAKFIERACENVGPSIAHGSNAFEAAHRAVSDVLERVRLVRSRSADGDDWQDVDTGETVIREGQVGAPSELDTSPDHYREARAARRAALNAAPPAADADLMAWMNPAATSQETIAATIKSAWVELGGDMARLASAYTVPLYTRPAAPLSEGDAAGTVADRLDRMADALPGGSQQSSDLRAAATAWRKHLRGPVTPSPSPQPTDEATDAERLLSVLERIETHLPFDWAFDSLAELQGKTDYRESVRDVRAAIAARLATPPDNAAGWEGVK